MKTERFKSSMNFFYFVFAGLFLIISIANYEGWLLNDYLLGGGLILALLVLVYFSTIITYLEIQNNRTLVSSGHRFFGRDVIDIFAIKCIYRHPEFILKWYGSRMVFYVRASDGKLRQAAQREINYSNKTIVEFLQRIKQINPNIELDHEYEKILKGEIDKNQTSNNTLREIENRLNERK